MWLPEAGEDLRRLVDFLSMVNPDGASRAAGSIRRGADRILEMPGLGRSMLDGSERRELFIPFGRSVYMLRYHTDDDGTVVVIRVWHGREARA